MAYGALLGAGSFVCMFVVGSVLRRKPACATPANAALVRDVCGYLCMLLFLVPAFKFGMSVVNALAMVAFYLVLLGTLRA
jgi:hypothetical protein